MQKNKNEKLLIGGKNIEKTSISLEIIGFLSQFVINKNINIDDDLKSMRSSFLDLFQKNSTEKSLLIQLINIHSLCYEIADKYPKEKYGSDHKFHLFSITFLEIAKIYSILIKYLSENKDTKSYKEVESVSKDLKE